MPTYYKHISVSTSHGENPATIPAPWYLKPTIMKLKKQINFRDENQGKRPDQIEFSDKVVLILYAIGVIGVIIWGMYKLISFTRWESLT